MKNKFFILMFFLAFLNSFIRIDAIEKESFVFMGEENHPPYIYKDELGRFKGFNIDIINALSIEMGVEIEYKGFSLDDLDKKIKKEKPNAIIGMHQIKNRNYKFNQNLGNYSYALFVRKKSSNISGLIDMDNKKVAVEKSDLTAVDILKQSKDIQIIEFKNQIEAIKALNENKVDGFLGNKETVYYYINELQESKKIKLVEESSKSQSYFISASNENKLFEERLEDALKSLKARGVYDKINQKWFYHEKSKSQMKHLNYLAVIILILLLLICILIRVTTRVNNKLQKSVDDKTQRINKLAFYDSVTGAYNKISFINKLRNILSSSKSGVGISIYMMDFDHFKNINDTLGHEVGDKLLKEFYERISKLLSSKDFFARFGGDEFVIAHESLLKKESNLGEDILKELKKPFYIQDYELYISVSIGVSIFPIHGKNEKELIKNAELAMYQAKDRGRNNICVYEKNMDKFAKENLKIAMDLRHAIKRDELKVYYQPKLDLKTGKISGMEALVRWIHRDMGFLSPEKFIIIAEETGLIYTLGEWVLKKACEQVKQWNEEFSKKLVVSVNLSARQFQQKDLANRIFEIVDETGLDYECLELEITETVAIKNVESAKKIIEQFRLKGINILMDDFGKGYSNIEKIKDIDISEIKIDKCFVMNWEPKNIMLIETIINLAHDLGLTVTAEGVENQMALDGLKSLGCDRAQGYYISKPIPKEDMKKLISLNK